MPYTREQLEEICLKNKKNFRGLKLHNVDFSGMDLERADFRSASCHYAKFDNSSCRFANFEGAGLMFTTWNGSDLHRANLKDASLCDADMRGIKDFMGVTVTMDCKTWKGMKLDPGQWYGFLFYGLLMEPPDDDSKERLIAFMGPERFTTLRNLYSTRRV